MKLETFSFLKLKITPSRIQHITLGFATKAGHKQEGQLSMIFK